MSISEFGLSRGFQHQVTDQDDRILEEVFRWLLHSRRSEPFFLNLHFMAAHDWYRRPSQVVRWNLENLDPELASAARGSAPFAVPNPPDSNTLRFLEYVRSVAFLRNQLVRILTTLSEADLLSRTIVFVYADHGEEFQDHREQGLREAADPRNIYGQGHGHSLYQEQLRIPMLAWVPGRDGVDIAAPASLVDVAPTLLSWLGRSRLGPSWDENPERPLFATGIAYGPPGSTVVVGNWKLIRMDGREDQLFNLSSDPRELRPLQGSALVKAGELGRLLDQVAPPARKVLPPVISPEQLESLRALGYISGTEQ
jgi:arylsulfatase A-like enzyme